MKMLKNKIKMISTVATFCIGFLFFIFITSASVQFVKAAYEEPTAEAPQGNIFVPLTTSSDYQAKKGFLQLNPLYNPYGTLPDISYPLEVRGPNNVFINDLDVPAGGNFIVDTDTLYVDGLNSRVGVGTTTPATLFEIAGGGLTVGSSSSPVSGVAISSTSETDYGVYGESTGVNSKSVLGSSASASGIGVYGLNLNGGTGIRAENTAASAVVGSSSAIYDPAAAVKIAGVFGQAKGLGSWAGYFLQRVYGTEYVVGNSFFPNRLQYSQVPYTAGWEVQKVSASELVSLDIMAFDGQYIWAHGWDAAASYIDDIIVINPDNMEIVQKIIVGTNGANFRKIIAAGGYIWTAHNYNGQSAVTRINPTDYSFETYYLFPPSADPTWAVDLLYDTQTAGGPYLWVLNEDNGGVRHSITQMRPDGTIVRTFSFSPAANGGNKCSRQNLYNTVNLCNDQLDNNENGTIDNGLCVYSAPADSAACTAAGGNWAEACTDRTFSNETDCLNGGAIWADTCSNSACPTQNDCTACGGAGTWDSGAGTCSDTNCTTQNTCEGVVSCGGTWAAGDPQCVAGADFGTCSNVAYTTWGECVANSANWTWNTPANDERLVTTYIGAPRNMTFDGAGNIWVAFQGTPTYYGGYYYAGEGYARFKAADPENSADQYVYCSGPETQPNDITYDSVNDTIWMSYWPGDNIGIAKAYASGANAGDVYDFLWQILGSSGSTTIKYFSDLPGGPSIWASSASHLVKINPDTNTEEHEYRETVWNMDLYDWDFDLRDPNNPVIWQLTLSSGIILRETMAPPYEQTSYLIKGAGKVENMIFDGTNIWAANDASTVISKYNSVSGEKLGDYDVGVDPYNMIFDGSAIWIPFWPGAGHFIRLDVQSGVIDDYTSGGFSSITNVAFDGQNAWMTREPYDEIIKVDLSSCDSTTKVCPAGTSHVTGNQPNMPMYDGESIWVSYLDNKLSKLSAGTGAVEATLTIPQLAGDYIRAMEFDGTYIWIGTNQVDASGNSVFKLDPQGLDSNDGFAGACSNDSSISCNDNDGDVPCGAGNTCDVVVAGQYPIFHEISEGTANVTTLTFDGTYVWATHNAYNSSPTDIGQIACNDNIDNDGNGLCDADGSTGTPGCSGRPDPSCTDSSDTSEQSSSSQRAHLTRIVAATGEIVESIPVRTFGNNYDVKTSLYDGLHIWLGGRNFDNYSLAQYYSGSGLGLTDLAGSVTLYGTMPSTAQPGSFVSAGEANIGAKLTVVGDLVVLNNKWGGSADNLRDFGTSCAEGEFVKGIQLSGAGDLIVYASARDGDLEIFTMDETGANEIQITFNTASDRNPDWSSDGNKIVFESFRDGNWEIYTMDADGSNQTRLTTDSGFDLSPSWSPDGTQIVFETTRDGNNEIYVMNADGTSQTNISNNAGADQQPDWSPDGIKIVYRSLFIYSMDTDGSNKINLTPTALGNNPEWSSDGTQIAFDSTVSCDGFGCIMKMDSDGSNLVNLTTTEAENGPISWSPDDSQLIFTAYLSGLTAEVYRADADGSNVTRLTTDDNTSTAGSWTSSPASSLKCRPL